MLVEKQDLESVKNELSNHIALTRQESGCLVFEVTQSTSDYQRFDVYEEFIDQSAFDKHQTRVKNSLWGEITANVARHYTINS